MNKNNQKKNAGALIGAAFLMATSAIGPGFLTQTGKFTDSLHGSFGFVILISIILASHRAVKCMACFMCIRHAWTGCGK
ncbi:MAG: hypothetical protein ACLUD0_09520 [Eubacterium ramulus]